MCGRFSTNANLDALLELLGVDGAGVPLAEIIGARANIAPSESIAVVANRPVTEHARQVELFSWGLVPFWTKDAQRGRRPFNVRAESLLERPGFHSLIARHRAVVPAAGFYEWKAAADGKKRAKKTPYFLRRADGMPMALAAVWETYADAESGARTQTCAIVTTEPNAEVRAIHERMPVILEPASLDRWLAANEVTPASLRDLLRPPPDGALLAERLDESPHAEAQPAATSPAETAKQLGLFGAESFTSRKGSRYSRP
jgi:putative SOS response-associated peptidase YedK